MPLSTIYAIPKNAIAHFDRKGQGKPCGKGWISARKKCSQKGAQQLAADLKAGDKSAIARVKRGKQLAEERRSLSRAVAADKGKKARDMPGITSAEELDRQEMDRIREKRKERRAKEKARAAAIKSLPKGLNKTQQDAMLGLKERASAGESIGAEKLADALLNGSFSTSTNLHSAYSGMSRQLGISQTFKGSGANAISVLDAQADKNLQAAPEARIRGAIAKLQKQMESAEEKAFQRSKTGRARGAGAGGLNRDIDNALNGSRIAKAEITRLQAELDRRRSSPARPRTPQDQQKRQEAIANFKPQKRRSRSTKPKGAKTLTSQATDITQPDQRRQFAQQELEKARREGRFEDAKKWEKEAKASRLSAVQAEQKRLATNQGELFGIETGSSLPLFNQQPDRKDSAVIYAIPNNAIARFDARKKKAGSATGTPKPCGRGWVGTNPPGCERAKKGSGKKATSQKTPQKGGDSRSKKLEALRKKLDQPRNFGGPKLSETDRKSIEKMAEGLKRSEPQRRAAQKRAEATLKKQAEDLSNAGYQTPDWTSIDGTIAMRSGESNFVAVPRNGKKTGKSFDVVNLETQEYVGKMGRKEAIAWLDAESRSRARDNLANATTSPQSSPAPSQAKQKRTAQAKPKRTATLPDSSVPLDGKNFESWVSEAKSRVSQQVTQANGDRSKFYKGPDDFFASELEGYSISPKTGKPTGVTMWGIDRPMSLKKAYAIARQRYQERYGEQKTPERREPSSGGSSPSSTPKKGRKKPVNLNKLSPAEQEAVSKSKQVNFLEKRLARLNDRIDNYSGLNVLRDADFSDLLRKQSAAEKKLTQTKKNIVRGIRGDSLHGFRISGGGGVYAIRRDRLSPGAKPAKKQATGRRKKCSTKSQACGNTCLSLKVECKQGDQTNAQERLKKLRKLGASAADVDKAKGVIVKRSSDKRKALDQRRIESLRKRLKGQALTGAGKSKGLAELDPSAIEVDPKRFQYKITGEHTKSGEVGSLRGVRKFDPNLSGILQVWKDPADGKTYVVNGHNRLALAKRLGAEQVAVRYLDAPSPKAARAIGALTNIAEGRGTALDAAKFFRDTGISREDLEIKGIPMQEKIATDGLAMARLDDTLFRKTIDGDLSTNRAAIIGGSGLSHAKQRDLHKLIESQGKRRALTDQAVQELAEIAKSSESQTSQTMSLFGAETVETSTVIEKAKLQAAIKSRLSREKKLFGTVSRGQAAAELKRGGNLIDREQSGAIASQAAEALGVFDQMKNLSGPISQALNEAAARVANGENLKTVEREIYGQILDTIQSETGAARRGAA